ncbi:lysozyme inhibitor LprI family protein [Labrys sp. WJW]|uniref:lysozyme inhibitor LprI family protein n=1 Tax=Labrys sp. WJW TaxID=1737983 RepID=UPI0009EE64B5|nr:lysozyme inhibitor LprI family protein [Labrys sp. WJW]
MIGHGLAVACLLPVIAMPAIALAAGKPSFDCRKASTEVEKAICASPALSKADAEIAVAYERLRKALDPQAAAALAADQRWFVGARDEAGASKEGVGAFRTLKERLTERARFLKGIRVKPQGGFVGSWRNNAGGFDIEAKPDGSLTVSGDVVEPVMGRWVCEVSGSGRDAGGVLEVKQDGEASILKLTHEGASLKAETVFPAGATERSVGYCGMNGSADGSYFQVPPGSK